MIFIDWRPVSADSFLPRIVGSEDFDLNQDAGIQKIESAISSHPSSFLSIINFIQRYVIWFGYTIRSDGIFIVAAKFRNKEDADVAHVASALSYIVKARCGHSHIADKAVHMGNFQNTIDSEISHHSPVIVGELIDNKMTYNKENGAVELEFSVNNLESLIEKDEALSKILNIHEGRINENEAAILTLRRRYAQALDKARKISRYYNSIKPKISIFPAILSIVCLNIILVNMNSIINGDQKIAERLIFPFFQILIITNTFFGIIYIILNRFEFDKKLKILKNDYLNSWHFNDFQKSTRPYKNFVERVIYHKNVFNLALVIFSGSVILLVSLGDKAAIISRQVLGIPFTPLEISDQIPQYMFDQENLHIYVAIWFAIPVTLYIQRIRFHRRKKIVSWDICKVYMLYGATLDGIVRRITLEEKPKAMNRQSGFLYSAEIADHYLNHERRKFILDYFTLFMLVMIVFTLWQVREPYSQCSLPNACKYATWYGQAPAARPEAPETRAP